MTGPDYAAIPGVDRVLATPEVRAIAERCDLGLVKGMVRAAVDDLRAAVRDGRAQGEADGLMAAVTADVARRFEAALTPNLRAVVNATGVVLHTNMGRAPLAEEAIAAVARTAGGYTNLELDLATGERGSRTGLVEKLLCDLTGAEAAAVVNNNAAAVLLALNTLSLGREAIVSRGQLVEIGGSFRIPDVMARSGAVMREVGTTNRTHLSDYEGAIGPAAGLLLAVHPSNFEVVGFTAAVALPDLVRLGRRAGVPVLQDLGSGALVDLGPYGLGHEPLVRDSVAAGADVVTFSGDKVLGGPQSGLLVGKRAAIEAIRKNPLMRALRCGKLTYAALEATLRLYLNPAELARRLPAYRALTEPAASVRRRAKRLVNLLADVPGRFEVVDAVARVGSGALPTAEVPSAAVQVRLDGRSADATARELRGFETPVVGYVRDDVVHLDMRTVRSDEVKTVAAAVRAGLKPRTRSAKPAEAG